jgi:hypothetical protein
MARCHRRKLSKHSGDEVKFHKAKLDTKIGDTTQRGDDPAKVAQTSKSNSISRNRRRRRMFCRRYRSAAFTPLQRSRSPSSIPISQAMERRAVKRRKRRAPLVAASPLCAVLGISQSASHPNATVLPTWKSATRPPQHKLPKDSDSPQSYCGGWTQQVWKSALRRAWRTHPGAAVLHAFVESSQLATFSRY